MKRASHHLNVVGDFFVENDCCLNCGVPQAEAPDLFGTGPESCFVKKQPGSEVELSQMLSAMRYQEVNCIQYAGRDPVVIERIVAQGDRNLVVTEGLELRGDEPSEPSLLTRLARRLRRFWS